jgi:hypothetical protein
MKLTTLLQFSLTMVFSHQLIAANKCPGNQELQGREDMVKQFVSGTHKEAPSKFRDFCEANKKVIVCKTEIYTKAETKVKIAELIKLSKSSEAQTLADHSNNTNTVYFYMPK